MNSAPQKQLDALTGLRFLTSYHIVMFHHGEQALIALPIWLKNILAGPGGVGLFFVLSGFILTYVYHSRFQAKTMTLKAFLLARFARVYPTYLLGLVLMAPFFFPPFFEFSSTLMGFVKLMATVIPTLLLIHVWLPPIALSWNGPDWAVAVMFFFYLIFPSSALFLTKFPLKRLYGLCGALILLTMIPAATVVTFPIPEIAWQEGLRALPITRIPEFFVGIVIGSIFLKTKASEASRLGSLFSNVGAIMTIVVMAVGLALPYFIYKPLLVLGFGIIIFGLAFGQGAIANLLSMPTLVLLGHAGFPIYIFSLPIWGWCNRLARRTGFLESNAPLFFLFYTVVLLTFSILVLQFYENPMRKLIRRALKAKV